MITLRLRFTMRWLFVGFAIATVAFYVLFIRPTIIAERFVRVVEEGDLKQAASMLIGDEQLSGVPHVHADFGSASSAAQISPRTWSDIWHFRRTISLIMSVNSGSAFNVTASAAATINQVAPKLPELWEGPSLLIYQDNAVYHAGPFRVRLVEEKGGYVW